MLSAVIGMPNVAPTLHSGAKLDDKLTLTELI